MKFFYSQSWLKVYKHMSGQPIKNWPILKAVTLPEFQVEYKEVGNTAHSLKSQRSFIPSARFKITNRRCLKWVHKLMSGYLRKSGKIKCTSFLRCQQVPTMKWLQQSSLSAGSLTRALKTDRLWSWRSLAVSQIQLYY